MLEGLATLLVSIDDRVYRSHVSTQDSKELHMLYSRLWGVRCAISGSNCAARDLCAGGGGDAARTGAQ